MMLCVCINMKIVLKKRKDQDEKTNIRIVQEIKYNVYITCIRVSIIIVKKDTHINVVQVLRFAPVCTYLTAQSRM